MLPVIVLHFLFLPMLCYGQGDTGEWTDGAGRKLIGYDIGSQSFVYDDAKKDRPESAFPTIPGPISGLMIGIPITIIVVVVGSIACVGCGLLILYINWRRKKSRMSETQKRWQEKRMLNFERGGTDFERYSPDFKRNGTDFKRNGTDFKRKLELAQEGADKQCSVLNLPPKDQVYTELNKHHFHLEFPKRSLVLGGTLGKGAFGRVVKAKAIGLIEGEASTTVAVKMLKDAENSEQLKALQAELQILIQVGRHLNIVNLLGAVTEHMDRGELYVMVEYCCSGCLRHYLLKHKENNTFFDQLDHKSGHLELKSSTLFEFSFMNINYNMTVCYRILEMYTLTNRSTSVQTVAWRSDFGSEEEEKIYFLTTCDLLCFAFQCARGMEYLASQKLIHRDLAARNVLIAKGNVVKICDFGLAKDCTNYSMYIMKTRGLLPFKWMAIESILDNMFTTMSDVWSFGILLWELFTLGCHPYPGMEVNESFVQKLQNGYRMKKPKFAPDEIYTLMESCWADKPDMRTDFSNLAENLENLLASSIKKYYFERQSHHQTWNHDQTGSYICPENTGTEAEDISEVMSRRARGDITSEMTEFEELTSTDSEFEENEELDITGSSVPTLDYEQNEFLSKKTGDVIPMVKVWNRRNIGRTKHEGSI